ncbi:MAG: MFS transporter, partial [Mucinivorans sp.]
MVEKLRKTLSESAAARWTVLVMVSLTMMCGYFLTDVMAPLENELYQIGWSGSDYGIFNSAYGWLNFTFCMLIFSGIVLDKLGPRRTGVLAVGVMVVGLLIKYYALEFMTPTVMDPATGNLDPTEVTFWFFGMRTFNTQVLVASAGYAIFAVGYETIGITATKIIVRWFKSSGSMALALGMNVAFARLGTAMAMLLPMPIFNYFNQQISAPLLVGIVVLLGGFLCFIVFTFMDRKLDAERAQEGLSAEEKFKMADILQIIKVRGFWYIAFMCLLFYSAVFPFLKFATLFISSKFNVDFDIAGSIPSLLPFGTILLTPLFGNIYDKKGHGATIMIIGSAMLVGIYALFAIPGLDYWPFAAGLVVLLGVAFSLVPSAMWPSVAKIIPENRLGTAFALIFWMQNLGLAGMPALVAYVREHFGLISMATLTEDAVYDYTVPMLMFM